MTSNQYRINEKIEKLKSFTSIKGQITRRTYTKAYENAVKYLEKEMKSIGMDTRIDGLGTLIGTYNPERLDLKPLGIGSHIDTVENGGAYDGAAGIVAGLELIHRLAEKDIKIERPFEIIAFAEEEGGVFGKGCLGSEYMTGNTRLEVLNKLQSIEDGKSIKDLANSTYLRKKRYPEDYGWAKGFYHSFYEIHVEQGPILEKEDKKVGIVKGIVGIMRNHISFVGQSNHSGTTPMDKRKDASVAMAEFILETYRLGNEFGKKVVATNGKIDIYPNQHNVVPGKASASLELRGDNDDTITYVLDRLHKKARDIAKKYDLNIEIGENIFTPVKMLDKDLITRIQKVFKNDKEVIDIFSWAGHDAKIMANVVPSAMLFVPSKNGMSHCPEEFSKSEDIAKAVEMLMEVVI